MAGPHRAHQVLHQGDLIADTYRVSQLLGKGGMGSVWQADHVRLPGKRVAIKVLHSDVAGDPDALARFRREAEIASRLGHPNIVEVHDFNTLPSGEPYLVLELLVGETLDHRIARGPLDTDSAMGIAGQIASALAAAHGQGVIHRDLKPHNVFLLEREDPHGLQVKVLDFGISKIRGSQTVKTQDSTILGTPQYMAPEQALGRHDAVSAATDVFALGAMVYEMLAGRPAFTGQNIPEVVFKVVYEQPTSLAEHRPDVPARVIDAVHTALSKKPEERFAEIGAFIEQMAGVSLSLLRKRPLLAQSPGEGAADPLAATVDSSRRNRGSVAPPEAATAPTMTTDTEAVRPRRPTGWMWAVAGAAVVAAVIGVLVVMKHGESHTPASAPVVRSEPGPVTASAAIADSGSDSVSETDSVSGSETDSGSDTDSGSGSGSGSDLSSEAAAIAEDATSKPEPGRSPATEQPQERTAASESDTVALSQDARDELRAGNAALAQGDYRKALVHASRAHNYGAGIRAYFIRTMAYCGLRDLGNARGSYAQLPKRSSLRRKAKRFCRSQRQLVGD